MSIPGNTAPADWQALYRKFTDSFLPQLEAELASDMLHAWQAPVAELFAHAFDPQRHGHAQEWLELFAGMPGLIARHVQLDADRVTVGAPDEIDDSVHQQLASGLKQLKPWRKGPFSVFGIHIDTEWRSDWKWQRLAPHISPLSNRTVLDVGCGSGYHCLRMAGEGAALVIGLEPLLRYNMQFYVLRRMLPEPRVPAWLLPLKLEEIPGAVPAFDTVFSMGVLYHRKSPLDHLFELGALLRSGGELILETLIIPGNQNRVLIPEGRYAKMRNVWFIPDIDLLQKWIARCGFSDIRVVDMTTTTVSEQRATEWMDFESLADFLDPDDPRRTIEGYPAPQRAIVIATKSG